MASNTDPSIWERVILAVTDIILRHLNRDDQRATATPEPQPDPAVATELARVRQENAELMKQYQDLAARMQDQKIESFEDLKKYDQRAAEAFVKLAVKTAPLKMFGRNYGFFGLTSTGKSTMINQLVGREVAETGPGETTTRIQPYDAQGYRLYDIPGRNDDLSYFTMDYVAFWKALTGRVVLITTTVKEMTKVFRLLDAMDLRYDIVVNKFDNVQEEQREAFKRQVDAQIRECDLKGVNHVWYVSAIDPAKFPDWSQLVNYLRNTS